MGAAPQFLGESHLRIGDADFHYEHPLGEVPAGRLGIEKTRSLLDDYLELWAEQRPRRVVELGVRQGGSTAMFCQLGGLERIVSIELSDARVEALDRYVLAHGAEDVVRPHYGVDQADRERVSAIVDDELRGTPIDLVIDDASHLYAESRASFEVLFPRVRPGGLYLLEDWRWQHMMATLVAAAARKDPDARRRIEERMIAEDRAAPESAMSRLVLELVIARAVSGDAVEELVVGDHWVAVRRGPAALDAATFRVDDIAPDDLVLLAPAR